MESITCIKDVLGQKGKKLFIEGRLCLVFWDIDVKGKRTFKVQTIHGAWRVIYSNKKQTKTREKLLSHFDLSDAPKLKEASAPAY